MKLLKLLDLGGGGYWADNWNTLCHRLALMACLIASLISCGGYWADNWNVLDGTIVLLSLFEILVTEVLTVFADGEIPQLSFLRMLRLLRIARALRLMKVR